MEIEKKERAAERHNSAGNERGREKEREGDRKAPAGIKDLIFHGTEMKT